MAFLVYDIAGGVILKMRVYDSMGLPPNSKKVYELDKKPCNCPNLDPIMHIILYTGRSIVRIPR